MDEMDNIIKAWLDDLDELGLWAPLQDLEAALKRMPPIPLEEMAREAQDGYRTLLTLIEARRKHDHDHALLPLIAAASN